VAADADGVQERRQAGLAALFRALPHDTLRLIEELALVLQLLFLRLDLLLEPCHELAHLGELRCDFVVTRHGRLDGKQHCHASQKHRNPIHNSSVLRSVCRPAFLERQHLCCSWRSRARS
jgi:hypothetical protein